MLGASRRFLLPRLLCLLVIFVPPCFATPPHVSSSISSSSSHLLPNQYSGINRRSFPPGFTFGALTWSLKHEAATNVEGKSVSLWDAYALKDGAVYDGTTPEVGGNEFYRFHEDIQLLLDLGMDSFKFSIAWTRMFPNGTGEVNQEAVAHYNDLIDSLIAAGIEPHVALYEQDMPQVLEDTYGGLLDPVFIDDFVHFANACFCAFGDRVKHWVTFEEGNDFLPYAYAGTYCPPGRCTMGLPSPGPFNCTLGNSSTEPYIAAHNMLLAHAAAVEVYREYYQATQQGEIGLVIWFRWFEPLSNSTSDLAAAQRATDFTVGWFLDPVLYGDYPAVMREVVGSRLPNFTEEQSASLQRSVDFIGLNAITAIYATYDDEYKTNITGYFQDWSVKLTAYKDGEVIGTYDGEYSVTWCMRKIVGYMRTHYNNFPTYITALGYGSTNVTLDDEARVDFFLAYLTSLIEGIRDGANVRGLFVWSLIDGFETTLGLQTRFGLHYVDQKFDRHPRLSALWFKHFLSFNETNTNIVIGNEQKMMAKLY